MKITRYLIAFDENGEVHLRRTLCVTHGGDSGEVRYDAKPVLPSRAPSFIQDIFEAAQTNMRVEKQRRKDMRRK